MYLADVARRVILVVLFDNRTTLGLVRLRHEGSGGRTQQALRRVFAREPQSADCGSPDLLAGAEDEIDRLFQ